VSDNDERPSEDFADSVAKKTFVWTIILAALTVGTIFIFILRY
jgi:hypothetical protein